MPGLSFLSPWFLAGVAAIGVPVLLHLFARDTAREQLFAATRFVPAAQVQQSRRRSLTDLLLLLLRCLALVFLALAFARPFFADGQAGSTLPVTVVAVDTSFSMAAERTWSAAVARAADVIGAAPAGAAVAIVAFDDVGRLVFPAALDRAAARRAVEQLRPGAGGTSFHQVVPATLDALAGRPGRLVIVTDGQRSGLSGALRVPESLQVEFASVPPARDNLAVTAVERDGARIVVSLLNGGLSDRDTEVSLRLDGAVVARQPASIPAGQTVVRQFDGVSRSGGVAVASLVDAGGLPADDERTLVLDARVGARVLLIAAESTGARAGYYVREALKAASGSRPVSVEQVSLPAQRLPDAGESNRPDVIVLLATRGLERGAREQVAAAVEAGTGLLVAVGPDVESSAVGELVRGLPLRLEQVPGVAQSLSLVAVDVRHPVFEAYADRTSVYSRVRVDRVVRIGGAESGRVLARFDSGMPALVEYAPAGGRVLVLASDLDARWNRWPLSATFVPFVRDAVDYLSARRAEPQEFLVAQAPAGLDSQPGAHVLPDGRRVAVNVDPAESSLDLAEREELTGSVTVEARGTSDVPRPGALRESRQSLWWYLLLGVLAFLVSESLASARRAVRES